MIDIDAILKDLVARRGSDLHLKVDRPPMMRISSELLPSEYFPVTKADMEEVLRKMLGDEGWGRLVQDFEVDAAYEVKDVARFRLNAFKDRGLFGAALRVIPLVTPTIDGMGLPAVLKDICQAPQGLVLVTGPTGSGKSTTLASMITHINDTAPLHIVTIEDPIEFIYTDRMCTVRQRQLGTDVKSLSEALRRVLRQDPDVILMGEMRDPETIELAMHAAETGHLVFSTLHTNDAKQTIDRIIDAFPSDAHGQVRAQLALSLQAVVSQRLVRRADNSGRIAAMEIMINSPQIRDLILEGKTQAIEKAMAASGDFYRMQTFNQSLAKLTLDKVIAEGEAMGASTSPNDLKLLLKGVVPGGGIGISRTPAADTKPAMKVSRTF
ncbi:MAG: type IV pilus twitching motility protein PilT [Planctomycetaceae bacterium]|nr:type IV pilus twitching motility protein PilT [Planctomycetaceae bacterium]